MNCFWDLERISNTENENQLLHDCQVSINLIDKGRYEARLPFKESHETLPDNYSLCEKQLLKLYNNL